MVLVIRNSRKSRQKIAKNMANFFKSGKNHGIKLRAPKPL